MDPASVFCPNLECPARGQASQGHIRSHSRKDTRFLCTACRKTFAATTGTALYRLRTSADDGDPRGHAPRPWLSMASDRRRLWFRRTNRGELGGTRGGPRAGRTGASG